MSTCNKLKQFSDQITTFSYWYQFYWHRIVRLWPDLAYVVLYLPVEMEVLHYRATWKVEDLADACISNWWKTLLFINSITDNKCLPWTWSVDYFLIFYNILEMKQSLQSFYPKL